MKKTLLALTLAASTTLTAASFGCCDGGFKVGGDALYWKACGSDLMFGITRDSTTNGLRRLDALRVKSDYDWGFRVFAAYETDCYGVGVGYTYFSSHDKKEFPTTPATFITLQDNGFECQTPNNPENPFNGDISFHYYKAQLRGSSVLACICGLKVNGYATINYLRIDSDRNWRVRLNNDNITLNENRHKFEGAAFGVGFSGARSLCGDFLITTSVSGVAAVGSRDSEFKGRTITPDGNLVEGNSGIMNMDGTACIPGFMFRLGLAYSKSCGCFNFNVNVGYKLDYYWNPLLVVNASPSSSSEQAALLQTVNVGFGGPYIGVRANF